MMQNECKIKKNTVIRYESGMALVTVIIFVAVAAIVITMGISLMIIQLQSGRQVTSAQEALIIAESGMENALIRLLRNPNYTGETLTFPDATATITVTGTAPNKIVTVVADTLYSVRTIQVTLTEQDGISEVNAWRELE